MINQPTQLFRCTRFVPIAILLALICLMGWQEQATYGQVPTHKQDEALKFSESPSLTESHKFSDFLAKDLQKISLQIDDSSGRPVVRGQVYSVDAFAEKIHRLKHSVNNPGDGELEGCIRDMDINGRPLSIGSSTPFEFTWTSDKGIARVPKTHAHFVVSPDQKEAAFVPVGTQGPVALRPVGLIEFNIDAIPESERKDAKAIVIWKNNLAGFYPVLHPRATVAPGESYPPRDWRLFTYFELVAVIDLNETKSINFPPGEVSVTLITKLQLDSMAAPNNLLDARFTVQLAPNNGIHDILAGQTTTIALKRTTSVAGLFKPSDVPNWDSHSDFIGQIWVEPSHKPFQFPGFSNKTIPYYQSLQGREMKQLRIAANIDGIRYQVNPYGQFATPPLPTGSYAVWTERKRATRYTETPVKKSVEGEGVDVAAPVFEKSGVVTLLVKVKESLEIVEGGEAIIDLGTLDSEKQALERFDPADPALAFTDELSAQPTTHPRSGSSERQPDEAEFGPESSDESTQRIAQEFDRLQQARLLELDRLEKQIQDARRQIEMRSERRSEIIERRFQELNVASTKKESPNKDEHAKDEFVAGIGDSGRPATSLSDFLGQLKKNNRSEYAALLNEEIVSAAILKAMESYDTYYEAHPEFADFKAKFEKCKPLYAKIAETGKYPSGVAFSFFESLADDRGVNYSGLWVRLIVTVEDVTFALPILDLVYGRTGG